MADEKPRIEVRSPTHQGMPVDHPRLVEYAKNAIRQGWDNGEVSKRIGLPLEAVDKYRREVEREKK